MGYKYTIHFMRNGCCKFEFDWGTNYLIKALWWLFKLRVVMNYKIITLEIRAGYTPCEECNADYCEKNIAAALKGEEGK